jgi:neutral ceramidase
MKPTKRVAVLIETSRAYGRGLLNGVCRFYSENGSWSTYFEPHDLNIALPNWLESWDGDGILARITTRKMALSLAAIGLPLIDLRGGDRSLGLPPFGPNNRSIAKMAFEHLHSLGLIPYHSTSSIEGALRMMLRLLIVHVTLLSLVAAGHAVGAEQLRAAIATIDITPPIPYRMCGSFTERLSTGTNDPLLAKAVVFNQGNQTAALVFCDLAQISLDVSRRTRARASREVGIPVEHIAIAATHSHTGPLYFNALRNYFHERTVQKHGSDIYEKVDYSSELVEKLVTVIQRAANSTSPVRLKAGVALENRLSFNRRFHMKSGAVRFNPGQQNPDIIRAAGPIDPEVGIVSLFATDSAEHLGAIVSFALHLDTVGGTKYSADFPRFIQDELRQSHGDKFISLFGAGTCGDINHVDVKTSSRRTTQQIGAMLAATIDEKMPSLTPLDSVSLAVRSAKVNAPLQTFSSKQIAQARENMDNIDSRKLPFLKRVEAYKILAVELRAGETLPMEVQVFRLNSEVAIVTLPGEVFVDLGIAIKNASPFTTTLVIELANDSPGYLPTRRAFAEGSYETVNSRVKPGGSEMLVKTAIGLLTDLADDAP